MQSLGNIISLIIICFFLILTFVNPSLTFKEFVAVDHDSMSQGPGTIFMSGVLGHAKQPGNVIDLK
jgi:hypothetical protein